MSNILVLTGTGATGKDYVAKALKERWGDLISIASSPTRKASLDYGIKTEAEGARLKGEELQDFQFFLFDAYLNNLREVVRNAVLKKNRGILHIIIRAPIDYAAYCHAVLPFDDLDTTKLRAKTKRGMDILSACGAKVVVTPWPTPWYGSTSDDYRKTENKKDKDWALEHAFFAGQNLWNNPKMEGRISEFPSFDLDERVAYVQSLFPEILKNP